MRKRGIPLGFTIAACLPLALTLFPGKPSRLMGAGELRFVMTVSPALHRSPLDGRLLLLISADDSAEPRFQVSDGPRTQLAFGIDIDSLNPGGEAVIDARAGGYPLQTLADIPAGEYTVQALFHVYETFHRSDGHTLKLPMDRGEGQHWNTAPGNSQLILKLGTSNGNAR